MTKSSFLSGSMPSRSISTRNRLAIDGHNIVSQEVLFKDLARIRDVRTGPDGLLYVVLNNPDKIIRLEPVKD